MRVLSSQKEFGMQMLMTPTLGFLYPQLMQANPQSPRVSWHLSLRLEASAQA